MDAIKLRFGEFALGIAAAAIAVCLHSYVIWL